MTIRDLALFVRRAETSGAGVGVARDLLLQLYGNGRRPSKEVAEVLKRLLKAADWPDSVVDRFETGGKAYRIGARNGGKPTAWLAPVSFPKDELTPLAPRLSGRGMRELAQGLRTVVQERKRKGRK